MKQIHIKKILVEKNLEQILVNVSSELEQIQVNVSHHVNGDKFTFNFLAGKIPFLGIVEIILFLLPWMSLILFYDNKPMQSKTVSIDLQLYTLIGHGFKSHRCLSSVVVVLVDTEEDIICFVFAMSFSSLKIRENKEREKVPLIDVNVEVTLDVVSR